MTVDLTQLVLPEARAEKARAALRLAVKQARDQAIGAGLVVEGLPVATDDLSQGRLMGAALAAVIDPGAEVQWKLPDGRFVTLSGPQILTLAQKVPVTVQGCFDHEAALLAAIAAGETPDPAQGWPDRGQSDQASSA